MSLRLRLLLVIGISLSALWSIMAGWLFTDMRRELESVLDNRLQASAQMVAGLIDQMPTELLATNSEQPQIDIATLDGLTCEVSIMRGEIARRTLVRTQGGPVLAEADPGFGTYQRNGNTWRVYVLMHGDLRIAIADRLEVRQSLLGDMALSLGLPFAVALLGGLILVWWAIGRGLQPLDRVRSLLARRDPADLNPLPEINAPGELQPLVRTIHDLLQRIANVIRRERQFTDDAAHELRTPLTAVRTHLQVAQLALQQDKAEQLLPEALACAEQGAVRLQETLDQLLLLARLDSGQPSAEDESSDVFEAASQALAELAPLGLDAETRVRLIMPPTPQPLHAAVPRSLLVSILGNLLDNALRYTPADRPVSLSLSDEANGMVQIRVRDQGAGLSDAQLGRMDARFWRARQDEHGSGLGLAIVRQIVEKHSGQLSICNHPDSGLLAEVRLPAAEACRGGYKRSTDAPAQLQSGRAVTP